MKPLGKARGKEQRRSTKPIPSDIPSNTTRIYKAITRRDSLQKRLPQRIPTKEVQPTKASAS